MFKKRMCLILAAFLVLLLAASPATAKQIKMVSAFPVAMPVMAEMMPKFIETVKATTNGEIDIKIFEPGKLVPATAVLDTVSKGLVPMGFNTATYSLGKIKGLSFYLGYPFGMQAEEKWTWLYKGNGLKLWQQLYDDAGYNVKVIPFMTVPNESAGWFGKPIEKLEDFKGLKMRMGGLGGQVMTKLGASVSFMPMGDVFTALERGVLDSVEFSFPELDAALGFYKVLKYNYFPGWHSPASITHLLINKKAWEKFTDSQRANIETAAAALGIWSMAGGEIGQTRTLIKNTTERGVQNVWFSDEIVKAMHDAWLEVAAEESAKDAGFKTVWDDINAFRKEYSVWKKYKAIPEF